jgi:hypothetical protein
VEHPLTSPLVEAIVSYKCSYYCLDTDFLHGEFRGHCIASCLKTGTLCRLVQLIV